MNNMFCFKANKMREFTDAKFKNIRAPFVAGIELTAKCNLRCVHCYAQNSRKHQDLTTAEVKKIVDTLVERNLVELFFTGGEVFTRDDFDEIYVYAKKKGLVVSVLSNITLLSEKHIELFKEYPVAVVSTTMYGYSKETYEAVTGIAGSFKKFVNAIDLLQKNGIPFEIKYVGMKQNIQDVHKIKAFGKKLGVNMVFGFDIRPTSDCDSKTVDYRVTPEEAFEFDEHDKDRREFWISVARKDLKRPRQEQGRKYSERYTKGYLYPCQIAIQHVFITSDYKMQGCTKAAFAQYDLKKGTFDDGWEYLNNRFVQPRASGNFKCLSCDKSLYCERCTANSELTFGSPTDVDSFYCEVASLRKAFAVREALKELD